MINLVYLIEQTNLIIYVFKFCVFILLRMTSYS